MSKKNVYFYELVLEDAKTGSMIPVNQYRDILSDIISSNCINNSIELTYEQTEPVLMDVLENTDEYLFVRLSRKRLNNSIQKRNYKTRKTTDVLAPQVNRISFDIARPNAELLEGMFGFTDEEIISVMSKKTASLVVDVKPDFRGYLIDDPGLIERLINVLRGNRIQYNTIKIVGKKDRRGPQHEYDLYEEYFKYPIEIKEFRQEGGRKFEVSKAAIRRDYKDKMTKVYDQYKNVLLAFVDRS